MDPHRQRGREKCKKEKKRVTEEEEEEREREERKWGVRSRSVCMCAKYGINDYAGSWLDARAIPSQEEGNTKEIFNR
jgi:hypothetical protein